MNTLPATPDETEISAAKWFKSSYSNGSGGCIEIAHLSAVTAVRDTKNRSGGALFFSPSKWSQFLTEIRNTEFGHPSR